MTMCSMVFFTPAYLAHVLFHYCKGVGYNVQKRKMRRFFEVLLHIAF